MVQRTQPASRITVDGHRIQDLFDRITSIAPIPPEAYPGGAIGKLPAVRQMTELAWDNMALVMFTAGFLAGLMVAVLLVMGFVFKTSVPSLMRAVASASI